MRASIPDPNELTRLDQSKLDEALRKHDMYLRGQIGGALRSQISQPIRAGF